jgi:hypothetical protein
MVKIAAYLLVGIGIGVAFAFWQGGGEPVGAWDSEVAVEDRGPLERRLSELETSLALERYERELLGDELAALRDALASTADADGDDAPAERRERLTAVLGGDEESRAEIEERLRERFANGFPSREPLDGTFLEQRQLERFVAAGFTLDRAQRILQREEELQMEVLRARYEATQSGAPPEEVARLDQATLLRAELGDADYEKYLEARGRPTTINVREVLSNSPAQTAGLREGDEIVAYNGKRVFDMNELNTLTYEGRPGETVALEVLRNGQPMQVYVTRGPIGITGGGRSRGSSRR